MKKIFESFSFFAVMTVILVAITCYNTYYSWYKPNQQQYKMDYLENELARNGYNRKVAKALLSEYTEDIHFFNVPELMLKGDSVFTYYTSDGYKVTYIPEFTSYKAFNTCDINTQMNVLTNIYRACSEHFQNEYQCQLDSLVQTNEVIYLSRDKIGKDRKISRELLDKEGVKTLWLNKRAFMDALTNCIKRHINDDNNITDAQKISSELFNKSDKKWVSCDELGELGFLSLDGDLQWEKLSDKEIKDREMKDQALKAAEDIIKNDDTYQVMLKDAEKIKKYEQMLDRMDFTIYGDFLFPGGSPYGLYLPLNAAKNFNKK